MPAKRFNKANDSRVTKKAKKESESSEEDVESETESESSSEDDVFDSSAPPKTIWLPYAEFHGFLAPLLNSSSTRKKTVQNYIAPESIRCTTQRTADFREGVWITSSGQIDLDDPRTGIYKCKPQKAAEQEQESDGSEAEAEEESGSESETEDDWDAEVPETQNLDKISEAEKKALLVKDLKESFVDEHFIFHKKSKQHQARTRTLMDATQVIVEDWDKIKSTFNKELTMKFNSSLHCEVPAFEMLFMKKPCPNPIKCVFDCKELILRCQCLDTFSQLKELVDHLQMSH